MIRYARFLSHAGYTTPEGLLEGWCLLQSGERFLALEPQSPVQDMSIALGVPEWMISDWCTQIEESECAELIRSLSQRAPLQIRSSPNQCTRTELQQSLRVEDLLTTPFRTPTMALPCYNAVIFKPARPLKKDCSRFKMPLRSDFARPFTSLKAKGSSIIVLVLAEKTLFLAGLGAEVYIHEPRSKAKDEALKRAKRCGVTLKDDSLKTWTWFLSTHHVLGPEGFGENRLCDGGTPKITPNFNGLLFRRKY